MRCAVVASRPQEMEARRDQAEQAVGVCRGTKKPTPNLPAGSTRHSMRSVVGIALADDRRAPRGSSGTPSKRCDALDRNEGQPRVGGLRILRAEEVRTQHDRVETEQDDGAGHRQPMLAEAPPHQRPVGGDRDALLGRGVVRSDRRLARRCIRHLSSRIRGSSQASRTSEISVPTMVRKQ